MLSIGLLSLICALTSGVFGFEADAPDGWTWEKASFVLFLLVAVVSFGGSMLSRPSLLWEVLDEMQGKQFPNRMLKKTKKTNESLASNDQFLAIRIDSNRQGRARRWGLKR
jgi:hypothetical protein